MEADELADRLADKLGDKAGESAEIGIGAAILLLRQANVARRDLVERVPAAQPLVDMALDRIDALVPIASAAAGAALTGVADTLDGTVDDDIADRVRDLGSMVADAGPTVLRLSGLTKRD